MIDTHAHFNSKDLKNLRDEIIRVNNINYLDKVINVGLDYETSKEAIEISEREPKIYATIGIHPLHNGNIEDLLKLRITDKVVAIGEIGLDTDGDFLLQRERFIKQIELANFLELPIILQSKNSNERVLKIFTDVYPLYSFVFHCFQPDIDIAKEIIKLGGYLSFATPITRVNAKRSLEVIKLTPIENILIELDYPYMSMNTINDGKQVFNRIKELKGYSHENLESQLDENAKKLFRKL